MIITIYNAYVKFVVKAYQNFFFSDYPIIPNFNLQP